MDTTGAPEPLSRRTLLGTAAAAAAATPADAAVARPNILCLVSEDNNPWIGAYGDRLAHTPTLDRLAAEGVLYRHAYSSAPVCAPSRFALITGMVAESCAPAHQMRARATTPAFVQALPELLAAAGYHCTNNAKTDYNCDLDPAKIWAASGDGAHWRQRPAGTPFFAVFNDGTTHESQLFKSTPGRIKPADVRVPAYLPDTPAVRDDIASYYNRIEIMDGRVAERLAELDASGVADDTIVIYYSDNGGVLPRSKRFCYDEGLRVALVVRIPPKWAHLASAPPGSVQDDPVALLDLPPTLLAFAAQPVPVHMHGLPLPGLRAGRRRPYAFGARDRMDERYDMMRTVTDGRFRYIRNYAPHRPWSQHEAYPWQMASWQAWETAWLAGDLSTAQRQFWGPKPADELYDLTADPDQITNLVGAPAHRARLVELGKALDTHMLAVRDMGFIPEGSPLEDHATSRSETAYPLRRAMTLAARAIARRPADAPTFAAGLDEPNEVIRYWSAQGLLMLGPGAAASRRALQARLPIEPSPQVRVVLAEALTYMGAPEPAFATLAELCAHANPRVRLQAVNALTFVDNPAGARPAIEAATADKDSYVRSAARYLSLRLSGAYRPDVKLFE